MKFPFNFAQSELTTFILTLTHPQQDIVAEWLRRWIANPLLFERVSSNLTDKRCLSVGERQDGDGKEEGLRRTQQSTAAARESRRRSFERRDELKPPAGPAPRAAGPRGPRRASTS
ncbi:hypothetical protein THAOC_08659, partial [Thalassiosira oceanica]